MSDEIDECSKLVDQLFCRPTAPYRGYTQTEAPTVVVPGRLFRASLRQNGEGGEEREVTVYRGVGTFAGEMWERSARTLIRLRSLGHPGLPTVRDVRSDSDFHVAFTMTRRQGSMIGPAWAHAWFRDHPMQAFEQFSVLLDALRQLHGARILHRGLTPGAFRRRSLGGSAADEQFSLAGFEMSMLIGNLVRRIARTDISESREAIRAAFLAVQNSPDDRIARAHHVAYLPPETHDYLFEGLTYSRRDWESTDVFGLGVFGWELFCGPLADTLPGEFGQVVDNPDGSAVVEALARLHSAMRQRLRTDKSLPEPLRRALLQMLEARPDGRRTTFELALQLENGWDSVSSQWEVQKELPHLVAVIPELSVDTVYVRRSWLASSPDTPPGAAQLVRFLRNELSDATLVRSQNGARGYATGPDDKLAAAEWVLIGRQAVWFCEFLRDRDGPRDEILIIKYLTEHENAPELYQGLVRRRVPSIEVITFADQGQSMAHLVSERPNWRILTTSLSRSGGFNTEDLQFLQSMDFLLKYQRTALDARTYPFERMSQEGDLVIIRVDDQRDKKWRHRSHLATAYMADAKRRPRLADFLESLDGGDEHDKLLLNLDRRVDGPSFGGDRLEAHYERRLDASTVEIRMLKGQKAPPRGWLQVADDSGTRAQQRREVKAREMLQNQPGLVQTLRVPLAFELAIHQWVVPQEMRHGLRGNLPEIVTNILATEPFYALQGPPGSGKTTAIALALQLYFERRPGTRVLVSAQSNFALDNIASKLMRQLPNEMMLREVSAHDGDKRVADQVRRLLLENVSDTLVADIEKKLASLPTGEPSPDESDEIKLLRQWRDTLPSIRFELADRVRSGASIVLATSSIASLLARRSRTVADAFDWVIVEEAAKAWPTEIMIPLVLSSRWTLIGDHRQLGAHRSDDFRQFLDSLEGHEAEELEAAFTDRQVYLRYLALFRSFFDPPTVGELVPDPNEGIRATGRLNTMFRMHPDIGEPIRRVFYAKDREITDDDGFWFTDLERDRDGQEEHQHGLTEPEEFVGCPLIWVDTSGLPKHENVRAWANPGEVETVRRIVKSMQPASAPAGEVGPRSLVVLTPYHAQRLELSRLDELAGRVHTVHSFQGREADRVVVSLVRDRYVADSPQGNVGLLAQDEVVNVLLSRAMSLLVLVGNFDHFAKHAGSSWAWVTRAVEHFGRRVHAEKWYER